jgi:hypothetical protein
MNAVACYGDFQEGLVLQRTCRSCISETKCFKETQKTNKGALKEVPILKPKKERGKLKKESDIGSKFDDGKLRYDLLPPEELKDIVEVLTAGAEKYKPNNWKFVEPFYDRYTAALYRHIEAWRMGETEDSDDNLHHLAHAAANIIFLLWGDKNLQKDKK